MEKDTNHNLGDSSSFSDPSNWKSLGFFSSDDYLAYVFKKVEKIAAAVYLVTGLLKDDEPLKWELRDRSVDLLSASFMSSSSQPGDKNAAIQSLFSAALEIISFLRVARVSGLVSDMNHRLLIHEIDGVISLLRDRLAHSAENAGYVLSDSFFKTPNLFSPAPSAPTTSPNSQTLATASSAHGAAGQASLHKGHDKGHSPNPQPQGAAKKTDRQEAIISLLKGHGNLTIKDFSKVITDCSEKTIQRELIDLVDRGIIRKEGERRWSTYSLK